MRVYFDDQIFYQRVGGVSRYFVELMQAYRSDRTLGVEVVPSPVWTQNIYMAEAGIGRRLPGGIGRHRRIVRALNRTRRRPQSGDVVHHTYYNRSYLLPRPDAALRVVTIYDMIPELFPECFPDGNPHDAKRSFVEAADLILCISDATKSDLIRLYGKPSAPITVTPLGVDKRFRPEADRPAGLPHKYVLYVGGRARYKDFGVLTDALANSRALREVTLVAIGGGTFSTVERENLLRLGLLDRVRRLDLSDDSLAGAYAHALCLAFPSRYEGFGLPTLEAMASGCPTVLAASSAHPEVGGDAAIFFDPGDVDGLADALTRLATDSALRERYKRAGLVRASKFTWGNTARLTATAYAETAPNNDH